MELLPFWVVDRVMKYAGIRLRPGVAIPPADAPGWLCWECGNAGSVDMGAAGSVGTRGAGGVAGGHTEQGSQGSAVWKVPG